ncbi:MAG: SLC13 family permease [Rhodospirillaceae bacterium]|nr:MAG: SLC13 family permease [Rhodospirillaceae bacterium]
MNQLQLLSTAIIIGMMVLFIWGRLRYDVVTMLALLVALALGVVPYDEAFSGFSDEIVIIVGSALVVSGAVARTGIMEALLQRLSPHVQSVPLQLGLLIATVTLLSAFVKNIGALAIMIPVAFQMARNSGTAPSKFLMPLSFGSLLGGLMTQIGTSPNIIVSRLRHDMTGHSFTMFDFTPVGAILSVIGIIFLTFGYRLLPERRRETAGMHAALDIKNYTTEAEVTANSAAVGKTVADLQRLADGAAMVTAILRDTQKPSKPLPDAALQAGDILLLEGDPQALDNMVTRGKLKLTTDHRRPLANEPHAEIEAIEAVIGENSPLIGLSAQRMALFERFGVNLLAVSRTGQRIIDRLGSISLQLGDVIVLQGNVNNLPNRLQELGCLPLAARTIRLGKIRRAVLPLIILTAAMTLTAFSIVPVAVAFFGAAVLMVLTKALPLREAYHNIEWPILIMLGALIPVSDALRRTGTTDLIAGWLSHLAVQLPPYGALGLILVAAMAVTPFLNNAATVLVMAPIAGSFATALHYKPDAFLMAVAIGAGCDFLTPIGHQCNTLVMGPGGYRFGDYWRLGLPLSILVILIGVPSLILVWPLQ